MIQTSSAYTIIATLADEMKANGIDAAMRLAGEKFGITDTSPAGRENWRDALLRMPDYHSPLDFALFGYETREAFEEARSNYKPCPSKLEAE